MMVFRGVARVQVSVAFEVLINNYNIGLINLEILENFENTGFIEDGRTQRGFYSERMKGFRETCTRSCS